jgi:three-Cys-motif partner protein
MPDANAVVLGYIRFCFAIRVAYAMMRQSSARRSGRRLEFGGTWTAIKLSKLETYLPAYTTIFSRNLRAQHFRTIYVDAFAGTGKINYLPDSQAQLFDEPPEQYLKGSATRALEVAPEFDKYVFIESDPNRCAELSNLKEQFPEKKDRIDVRNEDANQFLERWCSATDWTQWRAVVLLDPFAMDVEWATIEALGKTGGVDLWWLFPCGAFNRLLTRGRKPPPTWANTLTRICGTVSWQERFYRTQQVNGLFGAMETHEKISSFTGINAFLRERLATVFTGVVERPLYLVNSNNTPIFMLFFAASNPKGATTGARIARWIIDHSGN